MEEKCESVPRREFDEYGPTGEMNESGGAVASGTVAAALRDPPRDDLCRFDLLNSTV